MADEATITDGGAPAMDSLGLSTVPLFLTTADACARLGVSGPRLTCLLQQGALVPVGLTAAGGRLFCPADVDRLAVSLAARGVGRRAGQGKAAR